jgi:hypothetical protein
MAAIRCLITSDSASVPTLPPRATARKHRPAAAAANFPLYERLCCTGLLCCAPACEATVD